MYLPLAAVVTLVVAGIWRVLAGLRGDQSIVKAVRRLAMGILIVDVFFMLGWLTVRRNEDYRTEVSIWRDTAGKSPTSFRAQYGLGLALATAGQLDEAGSAFTETLRLRPDYAPAQFDWAMSLLKAGQDGEAETHFNEAIRIKPQYAQAQDGLGVALYHQGKLAEAIDHFFEATHLDPHDGQAQYNLAMALREQQQQREKTR